MGWKVQLFGSVQVFEREMVFYQIYAKAMKEKMELEHYEQFEKLKRNWNWGLFNQEHKEDSRIP